MSKSNDHGLFAMLTGKKNKSEPKPASAPVADEATTAVLEPEEAVYQEVQKIHADQEAKLHEMLQRINQLTSSEVASAEGAVRNGAPSVEESAIETPPGSTSSASSEQTAEVADAFIPLEPAAIHEAGLTES